MGKEGTFCELPTWEVSGLCSVAESHFPSTLTSLASSAPQRAASARSRITSHRNTCWNPMVDGVRLRALRQVEVIVAPARHTIRHSPPAVSSTNKAAGAMIHSWVVVPPRQRAKRCARESSQVPFRSPGSWLLLGEGMSSTSSLTCVQ